MRPFVLAFAVLAASANPAPAQVADPMRDFRDAELFSRQQAAQQRAIALENQLFNLETRLDTEQRLRELQAQQSRHAPPSMTLPADAAGRSTSVGSYASIPDDRLAASNARVREASRNRR